MANFSISNGSSTTIVDDTPQNGTTLNFATLDNSLNIQINGVQLFVGGPGGSSNELQFQTEQTAGQTVRFADGSLYGTDTNEIWEMSNTDSSPVFRLRIETDGTVKLYGVKANDGQLEELELFNGLTVNSAAIAAAWNSNGSNSITLGQIATGPTGAGGEYVVCFASGTLIETPNGSVPVEQLRVSDRVCTYDGNHRPIRWIGGRKVDETQLRQNDKLRPVRIMAGALGQNMPKRDLLVSRQHRMLVSSPITQRIFGEDEVLIPAIKLTELPGIMLDQSVERVEYFHILLDEHEVIYAEGAPSESLLTGAGAMNALSPQAREEIETLFPEITASDYTPKPARLLPSGKLQKKLIARHAKNMKPCLS